VTSTPLQRAPAGLAPGRDLWLKREDLHPLGAFKWRGAAPVLERYRQAGAATVVTASTGNHGAATAWAAERLAMTAVVFAPRDTSRSKLGRMQALGADIRLVGADVDQAKDAARGFADDHRLPFFEDGAEPAQFDGYRAIAREIVQQLGGPPAAAIVPVGNGALLAGIGLELADIAPGARRIGVVADQAPVMALSHAAGRPVACDRCATVADGLAVRVAVPLAVATLSRAADELVRVPERAIAHGVAAYARAGLRVEAAAGAALAALELVAAPDPVVVIVSGANIDDQLYRRLVEAPDSFAS
jgi:threonine dehydratase